MTAAVHIVRFRRTKLFADEPEQTRATCSCGWSHEGVNDTGVRMIAATHDMDEPDGAPAPAPA